MDVLNIGPWLLVGFFITRRCNLLISFIFAATWCVPHSRCQSIGVGEKEEEEGEEECGDEGWGWGGRPGWDWLICLRAAPSESIWRLM